MTDHLTDEYGLRGVLPVDHPGRRILTGDFPTGPAVGEPLPDVVLTNQHGATVDLHAARDGQKAAVLFLRSVLW